MDEARQEAEALLNLGIDRLLESFDEHTLVQLEEALERARRRHDHELVCRLIPVIYYVLSSYGYRQRALTFIKDAVHLRRHSTHRDRRVELWRNYAEAALTCDQEAAGWKAFRKAERLCRTPQARDSRVELYALFGTFVHRRWGPEKALPYTTHAAELALPISPFTDTQHIAFSVHASVLAELGQATAAYPWSVRAQYVLDHIAHYRVLEIERKRIANGLFQLTGASNFQRLTDRFLEANQPPWGIPGIHATNLITQAGAAWESADYDQALDKLYTALGEAHRIADNLLQVNVGLQLADRLRIRSRNDESLAVLLDAGQVAIRMGSSVWKLRAYCHLALALHRSGRLAELSQCLREAEQVATAVDYPELLVFFRWTAALAARSNRDLPQVLHHTDGAITHLLEAVAQVQSPAQFAALLNEWEVIFDSALEALWTLGKNDQTTAAALLRVIDARQCVAVRTFLQGWPRLPQAPITNWSARRDAVPFCCHAGEPALARSRSRKSTTASSSSVPYEHIVASRPRVQRYLQAARKSQRPPAKMWFRPADLPKILPWGDSVAILMTPLRNDLLYVPLRRLGHETPPHAATETNIVIVPDGCEALRVFETEVLENELAFIRERQSQHEHAAEPDSALLCGTDWSDSLAALARDLRLEQLVQAIEPDSALRGAIHAVLIPDSQLCRIPLHAAVLSDGRRFYEHFATLRYAHSLTALKLQQALERHRCPATPVPLRGVAFAVPRPRTLADDMPGQLTGVIREVDALNAEGGDDAWWIHGDQPDSDNEATLAHFLDRHNAGNLLVLSGHGEIIPVDTASRFQATTNDTIAQFHFTDAPLTSRHLRNGSFDFRNVDLVFANTCLLGDLRSLGSSEVDGFLAALTSAGCRRVVSPLWELSDEVAPEFARCLIKTLRRHAFSSSSRAPHAFARAFREAVDALRQFDNGRFEHEYFWAPYMLYGLG